MLPWQESLSHFIPGGSPADRGCVGFPPFTSKERHISNSGRDVDRRVDGN